MQENTGDPDTLSSASDHSAGDFSDWLDQTQSIFRHQKTGADVPCGTCTACCRSYQFIQIQPDETETLRAIPKELLFQAPGFPKGFQLLGHNEKGECPMLVKNSCTIYKVRPKTCRNYDCRIFPATGMNLEGKNHAPVRERAGRWRFDLSSRNSAGRYHATTAAGQFLRTHIGRFSPGLLPTNPAQLAVLALLIESIFTEDGTVSKMTDPEPELTRIVRRISEFVTELRKSSAQENP